jgi:hypothetical protein
LLRLSLDLLLWNLLEISLSLSLTLYLQLLRLLFGSL